MSIYFTGPNSMFEPVNHIQMYSDSTPMVKMPGWARVVKNAHTITVVGGGMAEFVTAMLLVDAIHSSGGSIEKLVLPYIPGARQDRSNPTGDVLFTAASVANMINSRQFSRVVVLDPHSPVSVERIRRAAIFPLESVAQKLPSRYAGVIAPDKGAKGRAEQFAETLQVPIYYGGKTRDVSNGKLTGFTLEPIRNNLGSHYLVVDDICDGGGTFNGLADKIHEQGATADLYVSHGIFSKGTDALLENYGEIFTTNSLAGSERNKITVLAVVKEMENYNE